LFDRIRKIEDCRNKSEYDLVELITGCIAMFLFKEGSRNAFNNDRQEETFKENYATIFKLQLPHMDTVDEVMRKLEEIELEKLKTSMVKTLLNKKVLHKYRFLKKWFLVAVDGSGMASYSKRHCDNCLTKTSSKGKITYSHHVLEAKLICANGFSISLATEWVENTEKEFEKQDCEQKAFKRLAKKLKKMYPRLPICITADGLYPNITFFDICKENQWNFIVTFQDGNLPSVWKQINSNRETVKNKKCSNSNQKADTIVSRNYQWLNELDYHGHKLGFLECCETVTDNKGSEKSKGYFIHITNFKISDSDVARISEAGRLRWKIENEGFNTQKNLGYKLKHKYSRVSWLAAKNYYQCLQIAHLINQLLELSVQCKDLLNGKMTVKHLWKCMIAFLTYVLINNREMSSLCQNRIQIRFG
jgi:hypothetical protein